MSMYNLVFGMNAHSDLLLSFLGLTKGDFGRFRDTYLTEDGKIAVYTRLGGGNRDDYEDIIGKLQKHPNYEGDTDDDFDCTYATFYFSIPDKYKEIADAMPKQGESTDERWVKKLDEIKAMSLDELQAKYPELCQIVGQIVDEVNKK
jgi:hypothetical protein